MRPSAIPIAILLLAGCASQEPSSEADPSPSPEGASAPPSTAAATAAPTSGPTSFEDIEAGTELAAGTCVLHYDSRGC